MCRCSWGTSVLSRLLTRKEQLVLTGLALAIVTGAGVLCFHNGGVASSEPSQTPTTSEPADDVAEPLPASRTFRSSAPADADDPAPSPEVLPISDSLETPPRPGPVVVSVAGAVPRPGVYELKEGERVQDLIEEAGGARGSADLSDINLAAPLVDGTTLTVPENPPPRQEKGALVIGRPTSSTAPNPAFYTISGWRPPAANPSQAVRPELVPQRQAFHGTGPQASGLLDLNHATIEQLESLPGIGPKLAAEIAQYRAHSPFQRVDDALDVSGIGTKRLEAIRPFVCVGATR